MKKYLLQGEDIQMLTQQRPPILMVDVLFDANDEEAFTGLLIQPENMFCINGRLIESGIIEHIAQTASVFAGYKALQVHQPIVLGLIGEVKNFQIFSLPKVGDQLTTHFSFLSEAMNITLFTAETTVNDTVIARGKMKISMLKNS